MCALVVSTTNPDAGWDTTERREASHASKSACPGGILSDWCSTCDSVMLPSFKHQRNDDDWHDQVAQPVQDGGMSASVHCPSLLDVLGALQRGSWSLQHPVVAAFLSRHLPAAAAVCSDDAHTTVAVIVVLRSKFKHSKAGWRVHVKRAANGARAALGDAVYSSHKALVAGALGA